MNKARTLARASKRSADKTMPFTPQPKDAPPNNLQPHGGMVLRQMHVGPVPHPAILQKYDEIYPGAAGIIFNMATKEQDHRIANETKELNIVEKAVNDKSEITKSGQQKATLTGILMLGVIAYLGYCQLENATMVLSIAFLGGMLTTLVTGKSEQNSALSTIADKLARSKKKKKRPNQKKAGE